jgi:pimeloyl-ACP methyl ester carboxylesterase
MRRSRAATCLLTILLLAGLARAASAQAPRLFFETDGSGSPVVFVEDWATDTTIWFRVLPELRTRFELVRYDLRGQGRSELPSDGDYSLGAQETDLLRVLDALPVEQAHLVGAGYGGTIALAFALAHPERVRSLALINPHVAWTPQGREEWARFLEGYERSGRPPLADYASVIVGRWFGSRFPDREPWVVPFVDLMLRRQTSAALVASLRSWLGTELAPETDSEVPILLLWGERVGPPAEERRLHRGLVERRAAVEDAGWMPYVEAPRETARLLLDFWTSVEPPAAEPGAR